MIELKKTPQKNHLLKESGHIVYDFLCLALFLDKTLDPCGIITMTMD